MGIVDEVGPEVKNFKKGDRVVASFDLACGSCALTRPRHGTVMVALCPAVCTLSAYVCAISMSYELTHCLLRAIQYEQHLRQWRCPHLESHWLLGRHSDGQLKSLYAVQFATPKQDLTIAPGACTAKSSCTRVAM